MYGYVPLGQVAWQVLLYNWNPGRHKVQISSSLQTLQLVIRDKHFVRPKAGSV